LASVFGLATGVGVAPGCGVVKGVGLVSGDGLVLGGELVPGDGLVPGAGDVDDVGLGLVRVGTGPAAPTVAPELQALTNNVANAKSAQRESRRVNMACVALTATRGPSNTNVSLARAKIER
jgi:hypothetical protein